MEVSVLLVLCVENFIVGLFIFDVEHCPIGCGVWPAIWLNGFVAGPDQYHEAMGTSLYKEDMEKLVSSTISKEGFDRTCSGPGESLVVDKPDPHLSQYMGKKIYPASWPLSNNPKPSWSAVMVPDAQNKTISP